MPRSDLRDVLKNTEYAGALKEALVLRRDGTITAQMDEQLGLFIYSIAAWSIGAMVQERKLYHELAEDIDFKSEVVLGVSKYIDRVDLSREPKEIIRYLSMAGRNAITDILKRNSRTKRQHEDVAIQDADITANFYGEPENVN